PLLDILLRTFLHTGISGSASFLEHATLIVGMLGGAVAARENRLLALSTLGPLLEGRLQKAASIFSGACAAAVSVLLCVAGVQFVASERGAANIIAYGIPVWVIETVIPLGFGLIAARLLQQSSRSWPARAVTAGLACVFVLIGIFPPVAPEHLVLPA